MKRWGIPCAKLAVAGGLIYWLVQRGGLSTEGLSEISRGWPWLLLAQVPFACILLLATARWRLFLGVQGVHYGFLEIQSLVLLGIFFNQVLFGSIGGDVAKAYYISKGTSERRAAAVLTVFIDRALGLFVLLVFACIGTILNFNAIKDNPILLSLAGAVWTLVGVTVLSGFLFFSTRARNNRAAKALLSKLPFKGMLSKVSEILYLYKSHPAVVLKAVAISFVLHSLVILTNLLFIRALAPDHWASPLSLFLVVPLAQVAMAIPITPGGLGTGEFAYKELFSHFGINNGDLVSLLQRLTYCIWGIPGLLVYLSRRKSAPATESTEHLASQGKRELGNKE